MGFSLIGHLGTRGALIVTGGFLSSVLFSILGGLILLPFSCFSGRFHFGIYIYIYIYIYTKRKLLHIYIYIYTKRKLFKKRLKVFNSQRAKGQASRYTLALRGFRLQPPLQSHH